MNFKNATKQYEKWLGKHITIMEDDLATKHTLMAEGLFPFMRATFYRWIQLWPEICADLNKAPNLLAVGDLHLENFGTWRDSEGRLVWGVNDFDEAYYLPYTNDLTRLTASAQMAIDAHNLAINLKDAAKAVLEGYREGLDVGGGPFVLAEKRNWLRAMAMSELRDPCHFWEKMDALPTFKGNVPATAIDALEQALPEKGLPYRLARRVAGLGSLGRQRFVAIAQWRGGKIARETKTLLPSACVWARDGDGSTTIFYQEILEKSVRCPDPFAHLHGHWIVRRLAPDCSRIELSALARERNELRLMRAMGWEVANIHLGSKAAIPEIKKDLNKRPADWLIAAARDMAAATARDWKEWKKV